MAPDRVASAAPARAPETSERTRCERHNDHRQQCGWRQLPTSLNYTWGGPHTSGPPHFSSSWRAETRAPTLVGMKTGKTPRRRRRLRVAAAAVLLETVALKLRSNRIGGNVVVRCRQGHLFTTIWLPGASFKSIRFGWWRLQYCPVGKHWSIVTPVKESGLTEDERQTALAHQDIRLP
jgi:hypothetical protein